jgi:hypothetical protein
MPDSHDRDQHYLRLLVDPLRVCAAYKPMFGHGRKGGLTLEQFQQLYGSDPFYAWMGLDSPLMYTAHKAAGGMTSIYRQIGIGCQWIFQAVLQDQLGLTKEQAAWSYRVPKGGNEERTLSLDGRIDLAHLRDRATRRRLLRWMQQVEERVELPAEFREQMKGVVFEVRQGYKSKDSKRQNADIANASNAYAHFYVPVVLLLSTQIDKDVRDRYAHARWLMLTGATAGEATTSTYVFCRDVLGYDLAGFFSRNSARIKRELEAILLTLLQA